MKKLIDPLVFGAIFTAAAAWLAWHMWPTSWWGKLFWLVLVGAAINWAEHYLVFGAYVRGFIAGLILRRCPNDDDQFAIFKADDGSVVQPTILDAYLAALQFSSRREYYICDEGYDERTNEREFTLTTLSKAERAEVLARRDDVRGFENLAIAFGLIPPRRFKKVR